jgi:predicted peroxiredoxin
MKKILSLVLISFICLGASSVTFASEDEQRLFVSLTSDDLDRAAMAVSVSNKVLSTGSISATIYLSAQGVRWVDKNIPQNKYVNGKTIPEMLTEFMAAGGKVILCKMCMENIGGIKPDEVIEGVELTGGLDAMFAENTTVLTY